MSDLLGGSPVNSGQTPKQLLQAQRLLPTFLPVQGRLCCQGHGSSTSEQCLPGNPTSGRTRPGQHGEQKEHSTGSPGISPTVLPWPSVTPSGSQMVSLVPSGSPKSFAPATKGVPARGEAGASEQCSLGSWQALSPTSSGKPQGIWAHVPGPRWESKHCSGAQWKESLGRLGVPRGSSLFQDHLLNDTWVAFKIFKILTTDKSSQQNS